jgi:hypothetical protein
MDVFVEVPSQRFKRLGKPTQSSQYQAPFKLIVRGFWLTKRSGP